MFDIPFNYSLNGTLSDYFMMCLIICDKSLPGGGD